MLNLLRGCRVLARARSDYVLAVRNENGELVRAKLSQRDSKARHPKITISSKFLAIKKRK